MNSPCLIAAPPRRRPLRCQPFGWLTPIILRAVTARPDRLGDWLAAGRADWHFAGLALSLAAGDLAREDAVEAMLFVKKKRDVLALVAPDVDPRLAKLVSKCAGKIWRPPSYQRLAALSGRAEVMRLFLKARSINRRHLAAVEKLAPEICIPGVVKHVRKPSDAVRVTFAIDLVERVRPDLSRRDILRSLSQLKPGASLQAWARGHFREVSFPPPPWPGTERLKPLSTWAAVAMTAKSFRNCIRNYVTDVLGGYCYLYIYDDGAGTKAVVEFQRITEGVWVLDEINGPNNDPLTAVQEAKVIAEAKGVALKLPDDYGVDAWRDPSY